MTYKPITYGQSISLPWKRAKRSNMVSIIERRMKLASRMVDAYFEFSCQRADGSEMKVSEFKKFLVDADRPGLASRARTWMKAMEQD